MDCKRLLPAYFADSLNSPVYSPARNSRRVSLIRTARNFTWQMPVAHRFLSKNALDRLAQFIPSSEFERLDKVHIDIRTGDIARLVSHGIPLMGQCAGW